MSNEVEPKVTDAAEALGPDEQADAALEEVAAETPEETPADVNAEVGEEATAEEHEEPTADVETEPEASTDAPSDEDESTPEATTEESTSDTQTETPEETPADVHAEADEEPAAEEHEEPTAEVETEPEVSTDAPSGEDEDTTPEADADTAGASEESTEPTRALSLDEIEAGKEYEGVVRNIQPYGAFVDIGAESDGLVHISELRDGYVEKVEDVVSVNEKVTVRVKDVDPDRGRISLTMRDPGKPKQKKISLRQIREGEEYAGVVTSIVDFGAFVDIGATTDGLVHISELSDERVNRVEDVVSEGQEVTVRVLNVDKRRKRISLSMRPPEETDFVYEEEEEDTPTLIELAFARAAEEAEEQEEQDKRAKRQKKASNSSGLSDIIRRTIEDHESKS